MLVQVLTNNSEALNKHISSVICMYIVLLPISCDFYFELLILRIRRPHQPRCIADCFALMMTDRRCSQPDPTTGGVSTYLETKE